MAPDVGVAPALERLLDEFMPVEPRGIEAAFDRMWQEASAGGRDTSSVRLRVSNFVVWGAESDASARFDRVMGTLAQRHPCRAILAVTAPGVESLQSAISAHCWRTAIGGRHICSEEILLRGRPGREREIASAILGLLVSELPVHLWLIGEPDPLRRVPEELRELADRVYVDAGGGATAAAALRAIGAALEGVTATLVDLAWERLTAWRELTAQLFDGRASAAQLERVERIEIAGGKGGVSPAALLMAGWLASTLELTPATVSAQPGFIEATCYDGTRGVTLAIAPATDGMELQQVGLRTSEASFVVEMHAASGHLHVRSDFSAEPVHRTVARDSDDEAAVITAAVEDTSPPGAYGAALKAAMGLLGG